MNPTTPHFKFYLHFHNIQKYVLFCFFLVLFYRNGQKCEEQREKMKWYANNNGNEIYHGSNKKNKMSISLLWTRGGGFELFWLVVYWTMVYFDKFIELTLEDVKLFFVISLSFSFLTIFLPHVPKHVCLLIFIICFQTKICLFEISKAQF